MKSRFLIFILVLCGPIGVKAQTDTTGITWKYNYVSSPRYSLDGKDFKKTRSDFSFKSFYPEFREEYGKRYGSEPLNRAENKHLWATLLAFPTGLLLGLGTAELLFHQNEKNGVAAGTIFTVAALPLLGLSIKLDFDSFAIIRDEAKKR